jgi:DNA-binding PadR family transcriptional regulator
VAAETPGVSRRQRIVYQITPAGRQYFGEEITDSGPAAWEDDNFNMRFAFFSRTDADIRLRILEGRRTRLQERLDRARYAAGGDDQYLSELRRHSIESVEREVRWLTDLINAERSNDHPGSVADAPTEAPDSGPGRTTPTTAAPGLEGIDQPIDSPSKSGADVTT